MFVSLHFSSTFKWLTCLIFLKGEIKHNGKIKKVEITRILSFSINVFYHFSKQTLVFTRLQSKSFENTVQKGEIALNMQFLFPEVFSTSFRSFLPLSLNLKLSSANSFTLEQSKIYRLGMG